MNLFNIGPMELVLILVLALIVFGPRRLPEVAKGVGKAMREFRQAAQELTGGISEELERTAAEFKESTRLDQPPEQRRKLREEEDQAKGSTQASEDDDQVEGAAASLARSEEPTGASGDNISSSAPEGEESKS